MDKKPKIGMEIVKFINDIQKILTYNGACVRDVVVDNEEGLLFIKKTKGIFSCHVMLLISFGMFQLLLRKVNNDKYYYILQ